jgi:hypothetical protein
LYTLSRVAHVLSTFFRFEYLIAPSSRSQFVDPRMAQDAEHPAHQRSIGPRLVGARQSPLQRELHQVVGVMRVSRESTRKAPQPG